MDVQPDPMFPDQIAAIRHHTVRKNLQNLWPRRRFWAGLLHVGFFFFLASSSLFICDYFFFLVRYYVPTLYYYVYFFCAKKPMSLKL